MGPRKAWSGSDSWSRSRSHVRVSARAVGVGMLGRVRGERGGKMLMKQCLPNGVDECWAACVPRAACLSSVVVWVS